MKHLLPAIALFLLLPALCGADSVAFRPQYVKQSSAQASFDASMRASQISPAVDSSLSYDQCAEEVIRAIANDFPPDQVNRLLIELDWIKQDRLHGPQGLRPQAIARVLNELGPTAASLQKHFNDLQAAHTPTHDPRWMTLYRQACTLRREIRLKAVLHKLARFVFTKHYDLGGSHYAYTEGLSDAASERHFQPGTALCILEMNGPFGQLRTLIDDPHGVIRDPDVSHDAQRILFSWKKSDRHDDYHLYEWTLNNASIRQITSGLGFADYEGQYLPNGDLIFNSTRCVQAVDCWWTEVSNLYTCAPDGKYLRRLAFDQVHTNFPTVLSDGRVIYTRWEYNDRGQIFPQALFQMYPDGTGQTEFYGNNSWFPTAILHARGLPGSDRIVCILSGHHTIQKGWLALIDPAKGRQENSGVQLIAPIRHTPAERIDAYGQSGDQFQYPYPLSDTEFLVTFKPAGSSLPFAIYYMTIDGRRELLVADPAISCNQPIPLVARPIPTVRPTLVDYRKKTGIFYLHDIYTGPGLAGIPRGTIHSLRVVALEYRAAAIGSNTNQGPAGDALVSTPVSIEGTWDVKKVLGSATVHPDGSASFIVPADTPLYFQALDKNNHAVQTMRSWSTLRPGEIASCVGCHEDKNTTPPAGRLTLAMKAGPQTLQPWYGPPRGFSFHKEIQPILDRHCIQCHFLEDPARQVDLRGPLPEYSTFPASNTPSTTNPSAIQPASIKPAFSLKGQPNTWSPAYRALANRQIANWINPQSEPTMLPPYHAGAAKSRLISLLRDGHYDLKLSQEEMDKFACWIDLLVPCFGNYTEGLNESDRAEYNRLLAKRHRWLKIERQNIADYLRDRAP